MFDSLLVGYGRAGERLHLPSLLHARRLCRGEDLFSANRPAAVDIGRASSQDGASAPVELYRTLAEAVSGRDPQRIVAHVCTPPNGRATTLRVVWATGIRNTICEKPIATSTAELKQITNLAVRGGVNCLVASPWLSSTVTKRIKQLLDGGTLGQAVSLAVTQEKPRFTRTQNDAGHPTAFEIELPHAVGLAVYLLGDVALVERSATKDMDIESVTYPQLGGASLDLLHDGGARSTLNSDFCSPVRRRQVVIRCEGGEIEGYFPVSADDRFAQLVVRRDGEPPLREVLRDEQFTRMLISYYECFAGRGEVVARLAFHAKICEVLNAARVHTGGSYPAVPAAANPVWAASPQPTDSPALLSQPNRAA